MNMLEHALNYAERGWAVLPLHEIQEGRCACGKPDCTSQGKHPKISGGLKSATFNAETIRQWWAQWPDANIGIVTGRVSGLMVVDIDHGATKNGYASLQSLEAANGPLPRDLTVQTGGGGLHIYLSMPAVDIRNSTSKLAPHIDVRGEGGYVVAPPSRHISGTRYTWENKNA
ncbi:MAG: bifunctional DNA primase/polymerase [Microgenomates group bacterium]